MPACFISWASQWCWFSQMRVENGKQGHTRTNMGPPLGILQIEVVLVSPAVFGLPVPLVAGPGRRHDAGRLARFDDHHHLGRRCPWKGGTHEIVPAAREPARKWEARRVPS